MSRKKAVAPEVRENIEPSPLDDLMGERFGIYAKDRREDAPFVIGGGISKEPRLIADLQQRVAKVKEQYIIAVPGFDVQPCYYRSSANLYGAMYNWLQKYHPDQVF